LKYAILIGDGMADYPLAELGGRTPLEEAHTPNMDYIAHSGIGGLVKTIPDSRPPGSDVANLEILGYDTTVHYTGRAPLEAAGMGIILGSDDVAFRCNLVTCQDGKLVDYSAGHISTLEASELIQLLSDRLGTERVKFYPGVSYRHLVVIKDGPERLSTTPPHDITGQQIDEHLPQGEGQELIRRLMFNSVDILNRAEVNRRRLSQGKLPANMIWLWGQGRSLRLPSIGERFGLAGGVISAVDLVKGIGMAAGLRVIDVPGATGYLDTNYSGKAQYALDALRELDLVYLHVEAPDEAAHSADLRAKLQAIEQFDHLVVAKILEGLSSLGQFRIMILPDHRTPLTVRTHTREPVPVAIFSANTTPDDMLAFTETEAEKGSLRIERGHQLIRQFIDLEE